MQRLLIILIGATLLAGCGVFGSFSGRDAEQPPEEATDTRHDPREPARWTLFGREQPPRPPDERLAGRAMVIDGDTLSVDGNRVHLSGIDAPERGQLCRRDNGLPYRCGQEVTEILTQRLQRDRVICDVAKVADNTYEGVCSHLGTEINGWMVRNGHAVARNRHSPYLEHEERAKEEGRGLWAGSFERPNVWRSRNR